MIMPNYERAILDHPEWPVDGRYRNGGQHYAGPETGGVKLTVAGPRGFCGGLAIAGTFLIDIRLGITAWLAAAAHEVPQELGDFGVLVHGGWSGAGR